MATPSGIAPPPAAELETPNAYCDVPFVREVLGGMFGEAEEKGFSPAQIYDTVLINSLQPGCYWELFRDLTDKGPQLTNMLKVRQLTVNFGLFAVTHVCAAWAEAVPVNGAATVAARCFVRVSINDKLQLEAPLFALLAAGAAGYPMPCTIDPNDDIRGSVGTGQFPGWNHAAPSPECVPCPLTLFLRGFAKKPVS